MLYYKGHKESNICSCTVRRGRHELCEMAQEYRVNVALLELRIKQLQAAQKRARQPEVRYRLKQRAKFLQTLINESRQTVFLMEHYHDHSEEGDAHADCRAV